MKNYKWLVVFLIFIFIFVAYWLKISNISLIKNYQEGKSNIAVTPGCAKPSDGTAQVCVGNQNFAIELATDPAVQRQGLSDRQSMDINTGMLFVYPENRNLVFWMKDMHFPIDLLWIDGDIVRGIEKNMVVPTPGTSDQDLKTYAAPTAVDKVLEINAGLIDKYGIKIGDQIKYYNIP